MPENFWLKLVGTNILAPHFPNVYDKVLRSTGWRLPHSLRRNNFLVRPIQRDHGARTPHRLIYVSPFYYACATVWSSTIGSKCLHRVCVNIRVSSCGTCCCASSCGCNAYSVNGTFCTSHVYTSPGCSDVGGDHLEEYVYLHEPWPQVRKWAADKKVHDMNWRSTTWISQTRLDFFLDL